MYPVDEKDTVVEISDAPRPDVGAPLPLLLADDHRLLLAYLLSDPDPNWDGTYVNVVSSDSAGMAVAMIRFRRPYTHMFGPPNDEAFFASAKEQYNAKGIVDTRAEIQRIQWLTEHIVVVDVRWPQLDNTGATRAAEISTYTLRRKADAGFELRVAVMRGVVERGI